MIFLIPDLWLVPWNITPLLDLIFLIRQFLHAPTPDHFQVVKRILRYVKGTISYGLICQHSLNLTLLVILMSIGPAKLKLEDLHMNIPFFGGGDDFISLLTSTLMWPT
uniref:Reverse transcriptase Ty1/copia-type domain-containing protein n=1 Tax=Lactuca sativa TaxID=4236 RepID=A0A9R1VJX3_LACSA|nr:hypothetical protein LSAT_V11C500234610 [Lactuca sativa]